MSLTPRAVEVVAGQGLPQHRHQRAFPKKNTAWAASDRSPCRVATFKPTSVLPAPGTPVTNTIAFRRPAVAAVMIRSMHSLVAARFTAPASLRVMSCTVWWA